MTTLTQKDQLTTRKPREILAFLLKPQLMEDYRQEIINLLTEYYTTEKKENAIYSSTAEILDEVRGVIPSEPINEHDIYDIMKQLGFQVILNISMGERIFLWEMYLKN